MTNTKHKQPQIEINEQFHHALDIMEGSNRSIFITGRAGTGKSTLLNYFRHTTRKKVAVSWRQVAKYGPGQWWEDRLMNDTF